jgi:hypothetical protein
MRNRSFFGIVAFGILALATVVGGTALFPGIIVTEVFADDEKGEENVVGRHEMKIEGPGPRHLKMRKRMGMLKGKERFLRFSKEYYEAVRDPHSAIGFAALGIKEKYRREDKPLDAIPELQKILDATEDRGARNILLFTIRQVYDHEKDRKGSERINNQILKENLAVVGK